MSKKIKVLLIVEGKLTEPQFFTKISETFGMKFEIYSLSTNIYTLYKMMKKESFNCDIKDILRELNTNDEYSEILSYKFAYTYLIFDCDAHNTERGTPKKASIDDIVKDNFVKLSEMAEYFTDETDPTIGKL